MAMLPALDLSRRSSRLRRMLSASLPAARCPLPTAGRWSGASAVEPPQAYLGHPRTGYSGYVHPQSWPVFPAL
jgi:hypothetical protein